jgi:ABC-type dipeptide/oligopeptide/nickel transport system ATPase component
MAALALERGRILGIVGESGRGKSTIIRAIIGILPSGAKVEADVIRLDGKDLLGLRLRLRPPGCLPALAGAAPGSLGRLAISNVVQQPSSRTDAATSRHQPGEDYSGPEPFVRGWAGYFGFSQGHELPWMAGSLRQAVAITPRRFSAPPDGYSKLTARSPSDASLMASTRRCRSTAVAKVG